MARVVVVLLNGVTAPPPSGVNLQRYDVHAPLAGAAARALAVDRPAGSADTRVGALAGGMVSWTGLKPWATVLSARVAVAETVYC